MGRAGAAKATLALAIVAILSADVYALTRRTNATTVTVDEAVQRFREEPVAVPPDAPAPAGSVLEPAGLAPVPGAAPTTTLPAPGSTAGAATPARAPGAAPTPQPPAPPRGPLRPAAGVYRYATQGYESVSILGTQRSYPPETTRTVRHGPGCTWTFRIVLLAEHQEEHTACSRADVMEMTGSTNDVSWFGLATSTRLTCDPPIRHADAAAGVDRAPFLCREGTVSTFAGTSTVTGQETVRVAGQTRQAWRLSATGTFLGKTRGTVTVNELIDQETGSTLFEQRTNDIRQQSPLGDIAYRQELTLRLVSLQPAS